MTKELTKREQILITEYNKSQNSIYHFDYMFWLVMSIFLFGSFVLIGSVIGNVNGESINIRYDMGLWVSLLGISSTLIFSVILWDFTVYVKIMSRRCKEIEKMEEFEGLLTHHIKTEYKGYPQKFVVTLLMGILLAFWFYVLIFVF